MEDHRSSRRATVGSRYLPVRNDSTGPSSIKIGDPSLLSEFTNHFNNLLAGIIGNAQLLENEGRSSPRASTYLDEIKACAQRASELTRELSSVLEPEDSGRRAVTGGRSRRTVLVIDDEDSVRNLSSGIISRSGFDVIAAADGVEGIEQFERSWQNVRCIFLDLSMPYMRGNLVFARLRAIDGRVPIFVMSGHSPTYVDSEFASLGVAGIIRKPFEPQELLNAVFSLPDREEFEVKL